MSNTYKRPIDVSQTLINPSSPPVTMLILELKTLSVTLIQLIDEAWAFSFSTKCLPEQYVVISPWEVPKRISDWIVLPSRYDMKSQQRSTDLNYFTPSYSELNSDLDILAE